MISLVLSKFVSLNLINLDNERRHADLENIEDYLAPLLLQYLSESGLLCVYHLKSPVYLAPSISIDPNDPTSCCTFLFLQSATGEDIVHRLSDQEVILWRLFVWNNLKLNRAGRTVEFKGTY